MRFDKIKIYIFALLAMAFWGFSFVWVKVVYYYYNPLTTVFLRISLAAVILLIAKYFFKVGVKPAKADLKFLFLLAFVEPFIYFLGESNGLKLISSTLASVIISTIPVFTPLAAFALVKEKIQMKTLIGIIVSFIGILIMVVDPDFSFKESPLGMAYMFLAVFSAIVYTVLVKKLSKKYSPITIITWQYVFGALLFLPLFLIFDFENFLSVKPDARLIITIIELTVFASILSYFFFITVVNKLGINKANVFINFIPVVTAISAFYILPEEKASIKVIIGILVVLLGIFIAQKKSSKRDDEFV